MIGRELGSRAGTAREISDIRQSAVLSNLEALEAFGSFELAVLQCRQLQNMNTIPPCRSPDSSSPIREDVVLDESLPLPQLCSNSSPESTTSSRMSLNTIDPTLPPSFKEAEDEVLQSLTCFSKKLLSRFHAHIWMEIVNSDAKSYWILRIQEIAS